eukprot:6176340-Pleurochrysis_carterae.AAC.1
MGSLIFVRTLPRYAVSLARTLTARPRPAGAGQSDVPRRLLRLAPNLDGGGAAGVAARYRRFVLVAVLERVGT